MSEDRPVPTGEPGPGGEALGRDQAPGRGSERPRRRRQREDVMVPEAQFTSYYGRPIIKPAPWDYKIPTYLYTGGLAAGSALVAAGAEWSGRVELQRNSRLIALGSLGVSTVALVADLGRPERFLAMMRTVKLTSPMSIGTWILTGFGAFTGVAATSEVVKEIFPELAEDYRLLFVLVDRGASLGAGAFSAPLAAYTAVLLANTATPTWHGVYKELPFVFVGSALAAAGGAAMVVTSPEQTGPARRMALLGSTLELGAYQLMSDRAGVIGEPLHQGRAGRMLTASKICTVAGTALTLLGGRRRPVAALAGLTLNVGSALMRFGVFRAGMESAKDPRYTVVPQRERLERRREEQRAALAAEQREAEQSQLQQPQTQVEQA